MTTNALAPAWGAVVSGEWLTIALRQALAAASQRLGMQLERPLLVRRAAVERWPLAHIADGIAALDAETVGVYLLLGDGLPGQAVLLASIEDARRVAGWMLGEEPAAAGELTEIERSALAELGNVALSSVLNSLAARLAAPLLLSPPAVIVDMIGVIFDAIATASAHTGDELTGVVATLSDAAQTVELQLWLIPDLAGAR
ncbi:MAG TPA: hypothetical protein VNL77_21490 [Roseiflexaceae bacterium]|nr:hypothetical protein [Roseiflexaceae bacterium]